MNEERTEIDYLSIKFFKPSDTVPAPKRKKRTKKVKDDRIEKERKMAIKKYAERAKKGLPLFEELNDK